MQKIFFALIFLIISIAISAQTIAEKKTEQQITPMPTTEITALWDIFSSSAMGVAFIFLLYAYFELRTAKKNNLDLQNQLIESHRQQSKANETLIHSFTQAIEDYAKTIQHHNTFMEKTMRILVKLARSFVDKQKN